MEHFSLDATRLSPEIRFFFAGPAGRMEARWRPAPPHQPTRGVIVVAHPHPAHGGTMRNKVVFHIARMMNHDLGVASLRFNFRGVESSEGIYDAGRGEVDDVLAAWAEATRRAPGKPLLAAGFSFGAAMTLRAAAQRITTGQALPAALALVGLPVSWFPPPRLSTPLPLVAVHGETDEFTSPGPLRQYLKGWQGPVALSILPGTDHFLTGRLPEAMRFLSQHLNERL